MSAGALHAVLYVFVVAPLINALGHWWGEDPFDNTARNIKFLSWLTGGESLHNNHHANPRSPKFSVEPDESDPAWPIIKWLERRDLVSYNPAHISRSVLASR